MKQADVTSALRISAKTSGDLMRRPPLGLVTWPPETLQRLWPFSTTSIRRQRGTRVAQINVAREPSRAPDAAARAERMVDGPSVIKPNRVRLPRSRSIDFRPPNGLSLRRTRPSRAGRNCHANGAKHEPRKRRASERPRAGCCEELGTPSRGDSRLAFQEREFPQHRSIRV